MAHGATGIGWALSRLALATGDRAAGQLAEAAFRYEESLYDPALPGWWDIRKPATPVDMAQWCHGAGGVGIAAADLLHHTGEPEYADRRDHTGQRGRVAPAHAKLTWTRLGGRRPVTSH